MRRPRVVDGLDAGGEMAAIAAAGLAALLTLPLLLVATMLLGAPFAVPAAIATGYLAAAASLDGAPRRARLWRLGVLAGLVAWSGVALMQAEAPLSAADLAAALLAPLFAAAPAVYMRLSRPREDAAIATSRRDAAHLDRLTPAEAVLFVDRQARLLAATAAASRRLDLPASANIADVSRLFDLVDRPALLKAVSRPAAGTTRLDLTLRRTTARAAEALGISLEGGGAGVLLLRLHDPVAREGSKGARRHA